MPRRGFGMLQGFGSCQRNSHSQTNRRSILSPSCQKLRLRKSPASSANESSRRCATLLRRDGCRRHRKQARDRPHRPPPRPRPHHRLRELFRGVDSCGWRGGLGDRRGGAGVVVTPWKSLEGRDSFQAASAFRVERRMRLSRSFALPVGSVPHTFTAFAHALSSRCSLTVIAVPRVWAKSDTRYSSSIQRYCESFADGMFRVFSASLRCR